MVFFFQGESGKRGWGVTGVQTGAPPIFPWLSKSPEGWQLWRCGLYIGCHVENQRYPPKSQIPVAKRLGKSSPPQHFDLGEK